MWNDLKTNPPTGEEYGVLLFPCRSDCGILYTMSNPQYAIKNGVRNGYTHWSNIELAPNHDELVEWQNNLTPEEIEKSLRACMTILGSLADTDGILDDDLYDLLEEDVRKAEDVAQTAKVWKMNDERNKLTRNET
jgi:hypothetical protein